MAKYKEAIYGKSAYGNSAANNATYTVDFSATPNWYNSILVQWGTLLEDADKPPVTHWRLVRSASGVPDHPDLGEKISWGEYRAGGSPLGEILQWPGQYLDNVENAIYEDIAPLNSFPGNSQITYSLWVYDGNYWRLVGSDRAISVFTKADTLDSMLRTLPGAWTGDGTIGAVTGDVEYNDLATYLSGFAFYYDQLRGSTELLSAYSNHMYAPIELIRRSVEDLGFTDEAALGDLYNRSLYKVGNYVNAYKGTEMGLHAYVTALTHWGNTITLGNNLFLDYQGSSFEDTVGEWSSVGGELTSEKYSEYTTASNVLGRVVPSAADTSLILQRTDGYFVREAGFGMYHLPNTIGLLKYGNSFEKGIPVQRGKEYNFYMYFMKGDLGANVPTVTLGLDLYNARGEYQYSVTSPAITLDFTWQRASVANVIGIDEDIDIVVPTIRCANATTNDYVLMDLGYFGELAVRDRYEDARTIKVGLFGERTNLLPNPSFDYNAGGWSTVNTRFAIQQSTEITPHHGTYVGRVLANGSGACKIVSDWIPVQGDRQLTFSVYTYTSRTTQTRAYVGLEYSTPMLESDQENIVNGVFSATNHLEESDIFDLQFDSRLFITAQNPEPSKYGVTPYVRAYIVFVDAAFDDKFYIDSALLEEVGVLTDYFQGDGAPAPTDPNTQVAIRATDCSWESGIITNYVANPSFETDTTGWSGIISRVTTDYKFGNACMSIVAGVTASTSVVIPTSVATGTNLIASAYVKGTGSWQIQMTGVQNTATSTYMNTETGWVRISVPAILDGSTVTINITSISGGKVDGVQLESGTTVPSAFSGPGAAGVSVIYGGGSTRWVRYGELEAGRSFYWTNFMDKISRLNGSIESVVPLGSTWEIIYGDTSYRTVGGVGIPRGFRDSFETSLKGWSSHGDTSFSRVIAAGYIQGDFTVEGSNYAEIIRTTAGTSGATTTDFIKVSPGQNYHVCAAVRSSTISPITITITKYVNSADPAPTTVSTTLTPNNTTSWHYLSISTGSPAQPLFNTGDATLLKIDISTTAATGTVLDIDRVVLRPV